MKNWGRIFAWVFLLCFIWGISIVSHGSSNTGITSSGCGKPPSPPPPPPPPPIPIAPSNLHVEIMDGNNAQLFWSDNSVHEYRFRIERSTDGINYNLLSSVFADTISYIDENLRAFHTYFYRVYATNSTGNSEYSNVASLEEISAKVVFVSSTAHNGNLGGLTGGDAFCQSHADSASIAGTFKAWLSDSVSSPSNRFTRSDIAYALIDGSIVAYNWLDLTDGDLIPQVIQVGSNLFGHYGIYLDEIGNEVDSFVYTGTDFDGTSLLAPPDNNTNCSDWNSSDRAYRGVFGNSHQYNNGYWTTGYPNWLAWCDGELPLYCFQQ